MTGEDFDYLKPGFRAPALRVVLPGTGTPDRRACC